jgi:SAM-dependent methyltransferase
MMEKNGMSSNNSKTGWTMKIAKCPWTENTVEEVEFVEKLLSLSGGERILDLGCGYGRHALILAERGFDVIGVDITQEYIQEAKSRAAAKCLNTKFICSSILDLKFNREFDVVLNLCDGAIGYSELENDNNAIFEIISRALVPNGQHLLQVLNRRHAELFFPRKDWDIGNEAISLVEFRWNSEKLRMHYIEKLAYRGLLVDECETVLDTSVRLYYMSELKELLEQVGMIVIRASSSLTEFIEFQSNELIMVVQSKKGM